MEEQTIEINGVQYYKTRITASVKNIDINKALEGSGYTEQDINKAVAEFSDAIGGGMGKNPDCSYLQAIFVSSGFNKNDDVFLPSELAKSFATARMKPLDIDHLIDEHENIIDVVDNYPHKNFNMGINTIIGALYDSALLNTVSGNLIPSMQASEKLGEEWMNIIAADNEMIADPDLHMVNSRYDVIVAGIMWKWLFPKTVSQLVEDIQYADRALSMEAFFRSWDWTVDGKMYSREEAPHLEHAFRKGGFNGKRVGRVLRGLLFGGAGIVKNPANPSALDFVEVTAQQHGDSTIFVSSASIQKIEDDSKRSKIGELPSLKEKADEDQHNDKKEVDSMPEIDEIRKQLEEISEAKANVKILTDKNATLASQIETLSNDKAALVAEIEALKASAASKEAELQTANETIEATKAELETAKTEAEKKNNEIKEVEERAKAAEDQVKVFEQAQLIESRVSKLDEAGVLVNAEKDGLTVASMTDETFDAFLSDRVSVKEAYASKALEKEEGKIDDTDDKSKANASEQNVLFPVLPEGMTDMHRSLAALSQSNPEKGKVLNKYSQL